jgi:glycosyltransferase involved in cell wall biosynthesis
MKKILIIMDALNGGGAEKVLIDILRHFDTDKYSVCLCLLNKEGAFLDDVPPSIKLLAYKHFIAYRLISKICQKIHRIEVYYSMERFFFRNFIKEEWDTIISFMEGTPLKYHSFLFDRCKNNVSWVHINLEKKHWTFFVFHSNEREEQTYNQLTTVVFVSKDAQESANRLFDIKRPNQKVIYNLIDRNDIIEKSQVECLSERGYEAVQQKFTICCVGRLCRQKRFDRAIDIVKILVDRGLDFELWILGKGILEKELKEKTASLNLQEQIKFWGFVKNPYPYMRKSDMLLITSDVEGYPLVACEALCLGLPIVSTNVDGMNEILDNGKYGIVTNFQALDIANVIEELMTNQLRIDDLSKLAEERANIFSPENTMSEIYNVI